jgi:hypothetical protein
MIHYVSIAHTAYTFRRLSFPQCYSIAPDDIEPYAIMRRCHPRLTSERHTRPG